MKQNPIRTLPLLAALLAPNLAAADALGVWVGADYWKYDIGGTVRYKSNNSSDDIDANRDLGYDDSSLTSFYVTFDHFVPMLPNVRIRRTNIDDDANGRLTRSVTYGGITFNVNEAVSSRVQLDQTDVTLYYRILDNVVSLDLGLNAKYLDIEATVSGAVSGTESATVSGWVPMIYAGVGADLPFTGLSATADVSAIGYQNNRFYDFNARVSYDTPWYVGVSAGYRKLKLNLDDFDGSYADIEFDGPYAGAYLHF